MADFIKGPPPDRLKLYIVAYETDNGRFTGIFNGERVFDDLGDPCPVSFTIFAYQPFPPPPNTAPSTADFIKSLYPHFEEGQFEFWEKCRTDWPLISIEHFTRKFIEKNWPQNIPASEPLEAWVTRVLAEKFKKDAYAFQRNLEKTNSSFKKQSSHD